MFQKSLTIQPSTAAYFNKIGNKAEEVLAHLAAVDRPMISLDVLLMVHQKKMGREMGAIHQLCHCHGIHLAVYDILHKKKSLAMETTQEELINDEDNDNEECWNEESSVDEGIQFNEDYGILISKVHKTVKLFIKSPLKNDPL